MRLHKPMASIDPMGGTTGQVRIEDGAVIVDGMDIVAGDDKGNMPTGTDITDAQAGITVEIAALDVASFRHR